MSQLSEIFEGWKNYVFENPEIEKLARERMTICSNCEKLRKNNTCKICNCIMSIKTRSLESECAHENKYW
jgi:hypothetical protein